LQEDNDNRNAELSKNILIDFIFYDFLSG
jgi:hypothetical protein